MDEKILIEHIVHQGGAAVVVRWEIFLLHDSSGERQCNMTCAWAAEITLSNAPDAY